MRMRIVQLVCLVSGALLLAACATKPAPPTDELAVARSAIDYAVESSARDSAPEELAQARSKLNLAEQAMDSRNYAVAQQLAVEAEAAARLADFKARNSATRRTVNELESSIQALRDELARLQGGAS